MAFSYKDLTYIRAALQNYEVSLSEVSEDECEEDEFSEIQDDIQYIERLLGLIEHKIKEYDSSGPSLSSVKRRT
ncbi:hypothetical protein BTA51_22370 [Hahella sp. CCB-MM4]|uniref:hypothetical protein n=1 Tax=Hahella sp. (strain CCB-MM4) TaxID=1926491 RepID=UPI000B9C18AD|nr:hypothetical protein [Hahella sp. CCB-MM4]OZG71126.1 hypothetical protein BTA51_22370 [Hahella sp. CCB-MM4]